MVITTVEAKDGKIVATGKTADRLLQDVSFVGKIDAGANVDTAVINAYNNSSKCVDLDFEETNIGVVGECLGTCPLCGSEIINGRRGYGCSNYKNGCKFVIWKRICNRSISVYHAKSLLASGKTGKINGFISKNNKSFDACLKLDENGVVVFDFS
jgi:DNA topoisomerase-3